MVFTIRTELAPVLLCVSWDHQTKAKHDIQNIEYVGLQWCCMYYHTLKSSVINTTHQIWTVKEAGFSCSPANKETQPLYIIIIKIYFYKRTAQWLIYNRIYWIFTNNNWNLFIFVAISKSNKKLSIYFHAFRFDWRKLPFARLSFSPPAQNQTSCSSEYWPRSSPRESIALRKLDSFFSVPVRMPTVRRESTGVYI